VNAEQQRHNALKARLDEQSRDVLGQTSHNGVCPRHKRPLKRGTQTCARCRKEQKQ
jgi:hypothetical protein